MHFWGRFFLKLWYWMMRGGRSSVLELFAGKLGWQFTRRYQYWEFLLKKIFYKLVFSYDCEVLHNWKIIFYVRKKNIWLKLIRSLINWIYSWAQCLNLGSKIESKINIFKNSKCEILVGERIFLKEWYLMIF